jgi:predicted small secreted protein
MQRMLNLSRCLGALLAFVVLAGCNTIEGVGEDLSAAGRAIDRAAEDAGR